VLLREGSLPGQLVEAAAAAARVPLANAKQFFQNDEELTITSSTSGTPTGTVTFLDGATALGVGTLNSSAVATFSTSTLTVGTHSITAAYGGDSKSVPAPRWQCRKP
jgi:hypothetical protein